MNLHEQAPQSSIQEILAQLARHYTASMIVMGEYPQADTEALYHYQLRLQAIDQARFRLAAEPEVPAGVFGEFLEEYNLLRK
ncbi:hypothetical protein [Larkinella soli]|uniref:hypothetical protein n=1 Tax=Larkinella soli TaxID=1770527 RepID=UPI000FFBB8EB|nr:hypothetical protein [Larkinella soli]